MFAPNLKNNCKKLSLEHIHDYIHFWKDPGKLSWGRGPMLISGPGLDLPEMVILIAKISLENSPIAVRF